MCGIAGYQLFSEGPESLRQELDSALKKMKSRGPDSDGVFHHQSTGVGQTRLSIIDPSDLGNQPMFDSSGRYVLVYNGEVYNYEDLRNEVSDVPFKSSSDTEVVLHLLIKYGVDCLEKLNGFFALAFYDTVSGELILARDRFGIKPLLYYVDDSLFCFGSEMKALLDFPIAKKLNTSSLHWFLKLSYLPSDMSMLEGVRKLEPGSYLKINGKDEIQQGEFFQLEDPEPYLEGYESAKGDLVEHLDRAVNRRLVSDVPLGAFLSGGTDSSAIVAMASRHHSNLSTFSIGYQDHPFFDETHYAELTAKHFGTNHTTFKLSNDDLLEHLTDILNYIDEPFADSSAIPTYILSRKVSQHVKVALSGDGADELFGGYYKHQAFVKALEPSLLNAAIKMLNPVLALLPQGRSAKMSNTVRRLNKYGKLLSLKAEDRYWFLASINDNPASFLRQSPREQGFTNPIANVHGGVNHFLDQDLKTVLPGDMLTKVDLMSMANSLEVRVPFLDRDVVQFARSLPADYKVTRKGRKRVLQDAFRDILPVELYQRPKKGFEVPLLDWMQNELLSELDQVLFDETMLKDRGIFDPASVLELRKKLFSNNPGDVHATIWTLFVFEKWYSKFM